MNLVHEFIMSAEESTKNKEIKRTEGVPISASKSSSMNPSGVMAPLRKGAGPSDPSLVNSVTTHNTGDQCWGTQCLSKSLEFVEAQFFMDFLGINITSYGNMVSKCETQSLKNLPPKYDICGFPTYLSLSQELLRYHQNVKHSPYELIHEIFTFLLNN